MSLLEKVSSEQQLRSHFITLQFKIFLKVLEGRSDGRVINEHKLALLWRKVVTVVCRNILIERERGGLE